MFGFNKKTQKLPQHLKWPPASDSSVPEPEKCDDVVRVEINGNYSVEVTAADSGFGVKLFCRGKELPDYPKDDLIATMALEIALLQQKMAPQYK